LTPAQPCYGEARRPADHSQGGAALSGIVIAGKRERIRQLGGEIIIDHRACDTAIKVMLPLTREHQK